MCSAVLRAPQTPRLMEHRYLHLEGWPFLAHFLKEHRDWTAEIAEFIGHMQARLRLDEITKPKKTTNPGYKLSDLGREIVAEYIQRYEAEAKAKPIP